MKRLSLDKSMGIGAAALGVFLWPSLASAAKQTGLDSSQQEVLILLAVVGVAYLVTHLVLERLAERYGFVTGVEYIVLGAILGPAVLDFVDTDTVSAFAPAIVLGTGSLGLWGGLHIDFSSFDKLDARALKSAMFMSLATLLSVVGVSTAVLYYFTSPETVVSVMPGLLCLGSIAMVADNGPLRSLAAYMGAEGPAADFGVRVAGFCSSIGIVAFGLIFCFYNTTAVPFAVAQPYVWLVWFAIHLLLGGVLGLIFATFLRRDFSDEKIITVIIGMVIFTSGFAYYLQLSPIFVNFILGVVLINTGKHADHVESRLRAIKRPLYIVLFFFAGIGWSLDAPWWAYTLVFGYIVLRRFGRFAGSVAATRVISTRSYGAGLGRALVAPGALSAAMLLNFDQIFDHPEYAQTLYDGLLPILYNGLLTIIVVTEIYSYPLTRSWLIDVADVAPLEKRKAQAKQQAEVS